MFRIVFELEILFPDTWGNQTGTVVGAEDADEP